MINFLKTAFINKCKAKLFESKFCLLESLVSQNLSLCLVLFFSKLFILEYINRKFLEKNVKENSQIYGITSFPYY